MESGKRKGSPIKGRPFSFLIRLSREEVGGLLVPCGFTEERYVDVGPIIS